MLIHEKLDEECKCNSFHFIFNAEDTLTLKNRMKHATKYLLLIRCPVQPSKWTIDDVIISSDSLFLISNCKWIFTWWCLDFHRDLDWDSTHPLRYDPNSRLLIRLRDLFADPAKMNIYKWLMFVCVKNEFIFFVRVLISNSNSNKNDYK